MNNLHTFSPHSTDTQTHTQHSLTYSYTGRSTHTTKHKYFVFCLSSFSLSLFCIVPFVGWFLLFRLFWVESMLLRLMLTHHIHSRSREKRRQSHLKYEHSGEENFRRFCSSSYRIQSMNNQPDKSVPLTWNNVKFVSCSFFSMVESIRTIESKLWPDTLVKLRIGIGFSFWWFISIDIMMRLRNVYGFNKPASS